MAATQLSITLPAKIASEVRAKVAAGEYDSESDVFREALRTLRSREKAQEAWLNNQVAASYDSLRAKPETGIPLEVIRAGITERAKAPRT